MVSGESSVTNPTLKWKYIISWGPKKNHVDNSRHGCIDLCIEIPSHEAMVCIVVRPWDTCDCVRIGLETIVVTNDLL
jgi:hypothetical protein